MDKREQLVLALPVASALGAEDFLVAASNREARAWIGDWRRWPGGVLAVFGPPGSGKTHLARIFLAASDGKAIAAEAIGRDDASSLVDDAPALALDDADLALAAGDGADAAAGGEAALLHLLNWSRERATPLLLVAATPPARWPVALPDLRSRLRALPAVGIEAPDEALMCAVIVKLFADRGVRIDDDVPGWLVRRIDRSLAAVRDTVARIDAAALRAGRRVNVRFLRTLFADAGEGS